MVVASNHHTIKMSSTNIQRISETQWLDLSKVISVVIDETIIGGAYFGYVHVSYTSAHEVKILVINVSTKEEAVAKCEYIVSMCKCK